MHPYTTDISVLMLFFNRPDHFSKVWAEVKKARPARLFLYQDGPREGRNDTEGIQACRELVKDENIDWKCEVHRNYQTKNFGCDPSGYLSQQWAFSLTDKCIVLEDDVVPSQSFFPFCKEMLDRYENDPRITLISGFNTEANQLKNQGDSYFFTRVFSIWGWASWSRVILKRDGNYGFVNNPQQFQLLKEKVKLYRQRSDMPQMCIDHANSGKQYFDTHFSAQLNLIPRRLRHVFTMPRGELTFPLTHPTQVEEYPEYQRLHYLRNAWNNPWRKIQYSLEELWLNLLQGNFSNITYAVRRRFRKWTGIERHK